MKATTPQRPQTAKPSDLNGGVYCLSKWCPGGQSPPLGAIVTFELKQGKYGDWRVAHPPGLAVVGHESILLERTLLDRGTPEMISGPQRPEPFSPPPLMTPSMAYVFCVKSQM